jgi:hypothetical protein
MIIQKNFLIEAAIIVILCVIGVSILIAFTYKKYRSDGALEIGTAIITTTLVFIFMLVVAFFLSWVRINGIEVNPIVLYYIPVLVTASVFLVIFFKKYGWHGLTIIWAVIMIVILMACISSALFPLVKKNLDDNGRQARYETATREGALLLRYGNFWVQELYSLGDGLINVKIDRDTGELESVDIIYSLEKSTSELVEVYKIKDSNIIILFSVNPIESESLRLYDRAYIKLENGNIYQLGEYSIFDIFEGIENMEKEEYIVLNSEVHTLKNRLIE